MQDLAKIWELQNNNDRLIDILDEVLFAKSMVDEKRQKEDYDTIVKSIVETLKDNSTAISFELRKMNGNK